MPKLFQLFCVLRKLKTETILHFTIALDPYFDLQNKMPILVCPVTGLKNSKLKTHFKILSILLYIYHFLNSLCMYCQRRHDAMLFEATYVLFSGFEETVICTSVLMHILAKFL